MKAKSIKQLVEKSLSTSQPGVIYASLGIIDKKEAILVQNKTGINVEGYERIIDNSAIKHTLKNHGNVKTEKLRGQVAVINADFSKIKQIAKAENIIYHAKNKQGRTVILYEKRIGDVYYYVEEVRTGRKHLALNTLYKRKPGLK